MEADNALEMFGADGLGPKLRHQARHRELFLSRHTEILPATHIRGKCSVTLYNEVESLRSYLSKDDSFYYCLVFDPMQKTLLADKGEIRVGIRYQTDIPGFLPDSKEAEMDGRTMEDMETLVWSPRHNLTDEQIDQFLVVSRSVGTFARALDCSSSVKQPSLHMSAAAASRDCTLFNAMDLLHKHRYRLDAAIAALVPMSGPVLCRDEMEEWTASEANLFEEAIDKYGKDFQDIRNDFLGWKAMKHIIEYYYMWKTTDRYVQQKRVKAVEAESKLKQVYIPNFSNKSGPGGGNGKTPGGVMNGSTNGSTLPSSSGDLCTSCQTSTSPSWHMWGPTHMQYRLCYTCWQYWKKYGGLKVSRNIFDGDGCESSGGGGRHKTEVEDPVPPSASSRPHRCTLVNCGKEFKLRAHLARHYAQAHGLSLSAAPLPGVPPAPVSPSITPLASSSAPVTNSSSSSTARPVMKTRAAFYLRATPLTRLARRACRVPRNPRRLARAPFTPLNVHQLKHECSVAMAGRSALELRALMCTVPRARGSVSTVAQRLAGVQRHERHEWLRLTPRDSMPIPERVAFPKPPKAPDGSLLYERVLNKAEAEAVAAAIPAPTAIPTPSITATRPRPAPSPIALKRRAYDDLNGMDRNPEAITAMTPGVITSTGSGTAPPPAKRPNKHPQPMQRPSAEQYAAMCARAQATGQPLPPHVFTHVNGKPTTVGSRSGRRHGMTWMDAPDDLYFRVTELARNARRNLSGVEMRRAARAPWRPAGDTGNNMAVSQRSALAGDQPGSGLQVVILD